MGLPSPGVLVYPRYLKGNTVRLECRVSWGVARRPQSGGTLPDASREALTNCSGDLRPRSLKLGGWGTLSSCSGDPPPSARLAMATLAVRPSLPRTPCASSPASPIMSRALHAQPVQSAQPLAQLKPQRGARPRQGARSSVRGPHEGGAGTHAGACTRKPYKAPRVHRSPLPPTTAAPTEAGRRLFARAVGSAGPGRRRDIVLAYERGFTQQNQSQGHVWAGRRSGALGVRCQAATGGAEGGAGEGSQGRREGWEEPGLRGADTGEGQGSVESVESEGTVEGGVPLEGEEEDYPLLDLPWLAGGAPQGFQASLPTAFVAGAGGEGGADTREPPREDASGTPGSPFLYGSRLPQILQAGGVQQPGSGTPGAGALGVRQWGQGAGDQAQLLGLSEEWANRQFSEEDGGAAGGAPGAYWGPSRTRQQALKGNVGALLDFVKGPRGPLQGEGETAGKGSGVPLAQVQARGIPEEVQAALGMLLEHAEAGTDNALEVAQTVQQVLRESNTEGPKDPFVALGLLACEQEEWGTGASWQSLKLVDLVLKARAQSQGEGYTTGSPWSADLSSLATSLCARLAEVLAPGSSVGGAKARAPAPSQTEAAAVSLLCTLCREEEGLVVSLDQHWEALVPALVAVVSACGVPVPSPPVSPSEEEYFMMLGGGWGTEEFEEGGSGMEAQGVAPELSESMGGYSGAGRFTGVQTSDNSDGSTVGSLGEAPGGPEGVRVVDPQVRDWIGESGAGVLVVLAGNVRTRAGLTTTWEAAIPELVRQRDRVFC